MFKRMSVALLAGASCLVTGLHQAAAIETAAYSRNAPGAVKAFTSDRKVNVTSNVPHQRKMVETDIACPLIRAGHISDIMTQVPVPTPTAKQPTSLVAAGQTDERVVQLLQSFKHLYP